MTRKKLQSQLINVAYILIDVVAVTLSFLGAFHLAKQSLPFELSWAGFSGENNPFKQLFIVWIMAIVFLNQAYGLYRTRRELLETIEILQVLRSVALSAIIVIVLAYALKLGWFPRSVWFISMGLMACSLSLWRIIKKLFVDYLVRNGYNNFNALIIGGGKVGEALVKEIARRPGLGINVVGYLDDYKTNCGGSDHKVLGKISEFATIAKREFVHHLYITIHHDSAVFLQLLQDAREHNIAVRVVPQGYEFISVDMNRFSIGLIPILEYSRLEDRYLHYGKRIMDLILGGIALVVLLPVFLIIAIVIVCDDPGPIFYSSKRYGKRGKIFHMLKFRSMFNDADKLLHGLKDQNEVDGPIFKMKNDPRITPVGAWLRKYSLDELPQIINVLLGDMSLVGPRPLPIEQVEREDLRQLKRLDIRPGITGLWQIRGRSDLSFNRLLRWDIWYINHWSFFLDLYILFQTIPVVVKGKGAY